MGTAGACVRAAWRSFGFEMADGTVPDANLPIRQPAKRRGAPLAPPNRFEHTRYENEPGYFEDSDAPAIRRTQYFPDRSRTIIASNDSPDVGFRYSVNPYRGCEHGCPYCYARPTHETLGWNAGIDFETKILVKYDAPELLQRELSSPRWQGDVLAFSGVTDCYQPIERKLKLTRRCLEVCARFRQSVAVVTKNALLLRDLDILTDMAARNLVHVIVSITTLDARLAHEMEPRASLPSRRLAMIEHLAAAGVPVAVLVAPVVPGLTDSEIPAILERAAEAGAGAAGYTLLRLPGAVQTVFLDWLERVYPQKRAVVEARVRACRHGRLNDSQFGRRMRGEGPVAEMIAQLFHAAARRTGLDRELPPLNTTAFRRPGSQRTLF